MGKRHAREGEKTNCRLSNGESTTTREARGVTKHAVSTEPSFRGTRPRDVQHGLVVKHGPEKPPDGGWDAPDLERVGLPETHLVCWFVCRKPETTTQCQREGTWFVCMTRASGCGKRHSQGVTKNALAD